MSNEEDVSGDLVSPLDGIEERSDGKMNQKDAINVTERDGTVGR